MDKKLKPRRRKQPSDEELSEAVPRGASFDTEQGRAAQGRRDDIGRSDSREVDQRKSKREKRA